MSEPAIARLIGEGVERPEASLPLDINYAKLAEWLVTRQKIPKDWHKRLQVIQAKSAEAIKEVPASVLSNLADGHDAPLDYLRAVEIRDALASTAERTMFGGLSGPAATWDKIVKAYEKQYVYLGECAQTLVQNVDYEIPYLRRQAAKLGQQMQDCERKHAEYLRNATGCAAKYKEECKKLGIQGVAVRQEVRSLASELPGLMRGVVEALHDPQLQAAAEYYAAFARFAHAARGSRGAAATPANAAASSDADASYEPSNMLSTLFEVREGRTQPPEPSAASTAAREAEGASAEAAEAGDAEEGAAATSVGIDWDLDLGTAGAGDGANGSGGGGGGNGGTVEINWDFDLGGTEEGADAGGAATPGEGGGDSAGDGGGGINWDIDMAGTGARPDGGDAAEANAAGGIEINWDIEVDAAGEASAAEAADAAANNAFGTDAAAGPSGVVAGEGCGGGGGAAAMEPDAVAAARLEADGDYRSRLMDDLLELRAFLLQRKAELSSAGGGVELLSTALPYNSALLSSVDASSVGLMAAAVQGVLSQLTSPRFRQLLLIATSQRYLDRLEASLQRQAGAEAKLQRAAADVTARQQEARQQLAGQVAPRVAALVTRTRRLKTLAEKGVAAALGGRRSINVLGEINNVLATTAAQ